MSRSTHPSAPAPLVYASARRRLAIACLLSLCAALAACSDDGAEPSGSGGGNNATTNNAGTSTNAGTSPNGGTVNTGTANAGTVNSGTANLTVRVGSDDARACEVMLNDPEDQLGEPIFGAGVEGRVVRRGDRVALAFAGRSDAPLGDAVGFTPTAQGAITLESVQCFDRDGRAMGAPDVALSAP